MPEPRLVIRVAVAGHLHIEGPASVQQALTAILDGIKRYAVRVNDRYSGASTDNKSTANAQTPELRIICQLAPGVDQMAAKTGLELEYSLHVVLPGTRDAVEAAIFRQDRTRPKPLRQEVDPTSAYNELLRRAAKVLQLDRPNDENGDFSNESYAQASSVILDHSDIVLVVLHDEGTHHVGGTRWVKRRAEELDLPLVQIPMERPSSATITWTNDGRRESRSLFNAMSPGLNPAIFESALNSALLSQSPIFPYRSGWFERRMINQLDPALNEEFWDERWRLPNIEASLAQHSLGDVIEQIDRDLKRAKVWADHRASGMANIVRGSFIFCALLGILAVGGALLGVWAHEFSKVGKIIEIVCLVVILCFIHRSIRWSWRNQWLSLRQLERSIEQAAWLLTIGRASRFTIPAYAHDFQDDESSAWSQWYLRSILRAAAFPNAELDSDYLSTVQNLVSRNLVKNQIDYFRNEATTYRRTDEVLEKWIKLCIAGALAVTAIYLVGSVVKPRLLEVETAKQVLEWIFLRAPEPKAIATACGAFLPAVAGALAAIRSHGEYAQIAGRYGGMERTLMLFDIQIERRMPDLNPPGIARPLTSAEMAAVLAAATTTLFQEVINWQTMLRTKEIEPV